MKPTTAPLDDDSLLPGSVLVVLDHPGQEYSELAPLLAHTTPSRSRFVLLRLNQYSKLSSFEASMDGLGADEWDVWTYREPPSSVDVLTRRIADEVDRWNPQWVALGSGVPVGALTGRPPMRPEDVRPTVLRMHDEGWHEDMVTLMLERVKFDTFEALARKCYEEPVDVRTACVYERHT